ncbi:murein L,D-transpeptidase catalytic domain-containing protein [Flavihumibacter fluvii]|uniref:murein L,D-transpeptidase catalytic domain-containing protein n=1 Tax=Flavihumibacter fluvii TaxID=2838157 RepID=UPI001EFBCC7E|nr:murein L,D-transpeptidase catalytic domain family protein [Flavihumibacter fluvii]ULQ52307.1 murein L,D-transpeptidase catalytic domain family protein [Flavihumibacter fluvii]
MKAKLCVAGIGGCLLLMSYFKPYDMFSSKPTEQSRQELTKSEGLLNYEKSNIPGLEVKTPAKIAIVNKLAVAKMKKSPKKEKAGTAKNSSDNYWLASLKKVTKTKKQPVEAIKEEKPRISKDESAEESLDELENNQSDINPYVAAKENENSSKPLVNMPKPGSHLKENSGRTVINYSTNSYVENTSNKKFPRDEDAEAATVKEETVNHMSVADKSEKVYAFRGKTTVKSSLYKYIPPYWDGFSEEIGANRADHSLLMAKARQLAKVAAQNGYNTEFAFLVDMSVKSNKNRFFVVNLRTLSIEMTSLVAQGRGKERLNLDKDYSNSPGSNCSSLGMYKIGKSYDGDFGRSYRLFGMDATNKNAYQRAIVLHAMGSIPNIETNFPIWQSEGCPSVSTLMLEKLGSLIDGSKKPVLMWMYDDTYIPMTDKSSNSQPGNSGS